MLRQRGEITHSTISFRAAIINGEIEHADCIIQAVTYIVTQLLGKGCSVINASVCADVDIVKL